MQIMRQNMTKEKDWRGKEKTKRNEAKRAEKRTKEKESQFLYATDANCLHLLTFLMSIFLFVALCLACVRYATCIIIAKLSKLGAQICPHRATQNA